MYKNINLFNNIILDKVFKYKLHLAVSNFNKFNFYIFNNLIFKSNIKGFHYRSARFNKSLFFSNTLKTTKHCDAIFSSNLIIDILNILSTRSNKDNLNKIFYRNGLWKLGFCLFSSSNLVRGLAWNIDIIDMKLLLKIIYFTLKKLYLFILKNFNIMDFIKNKFFYINILKIIYNKQIKLNK